MCAGALCSDLQPVTVYIIMAWTAQTCTCMTSRQGMEYLKCTVLSIRDLTSSVDAIAAFRVVREHYRHATRDGH